MAEETKKKGQWILYFRFFVLKSSVVLQIQGMVSEIYCP